MLLHECCMVFVCFWGSVDNAVVLLCEFPACQTWDFRFQSFQSLDDVLGIGTVSWGADCCLPSYTDERMMVGSHWVEQPLQL